MCADRRAHMVYGNRTPVVRQKSGRPSELGALLPNTRKSPTVVPRPAQPGDVPSQRSAAQCSAAQSPRQPPGVLCLQR